MHTVFRIQDIAMMSGNTQLFEVKLSLTTDDDTDLRKLTDHIRKETSSSDAGWFRMGSLLLKMGKPSKAKEIYEILLEQCTDQEERAQIYNNIDSVYSKMGDYAKTLSFYEHAVKILQQTLPPDHPVLQICRGNLETVKKKL